MIRPLRRRHRRVFATLAVVLPLGLGAALLARQPTPALVTAPAFLEPPAVASGTALIDRDDLWGELAIRTRVFAPAGGGPGAAAVELSAASDLMQPDVLVYWSAVVAAPDDPLPDDCYLLGRLGGRETSAFTLPDAAGGVRGSIVLYSLAHQQVIASLDLARPGGR